MDQPFSGQVFYIHSSIKTQEKREITNSIQALGGTVTSMFTSKTTTVIASKTIRNSSDYQLRKASVDGVSVKGPSYVREAMEKYHVISPTPQKSTGGSSASALSVPSSFDAQPTLVSSDIGLDLTTISALTPTTTEVVPNTGPVLGNFKVPRK
jgi:hypothetical protein